SLVGRQLIDRISIEGGGQQGDGYDEEGGQVFAPDDAGQGDGLGLEDLVGAGAELVGEAAHGNGGDEEEQDPGGQGEEGVEGGIAVVEQVVVEYEEYESVHGQEDPDGQVSGKSGEELSEFFFTNGPHVESITLTTRRKLLFFAVGKTNDLAMKRLASIILIWLPLFSGGQITVDGDCSEASWRILALVNTTGTPNSGFGSNNTLGVIKYHSNATTLFIAITGNVDANNNIVLFIDDVSYSGRGPNKLGANMSSVFNSVFKTTSASCPTGGSNPSEPNGLSGAVMDAGFDADYGFAINKGNTSTDVYMDAVRFSNYLNDPLPTPAYLAGPTYVGNCNQSGGTASYPISISGWNSGNSQISFAWQNGYDAATAQNKGIEISIPYNFLPGVALGHQMRFFALITNADGFASNVCVPGDPNTIGNAGSASNLGCSFNLSTITNSGKDIFYTDPLMALPLSFLGFKSRWEGEKVRLDWSVAEQGEANYFYIERSSDGIQHERIGTVAARDQGSTSSYSFIDPYPKSGRNFYRIAAQKRSGVVLHSHALSIDNQRISLISLYPNPTTDKLFIRMGDARNQPCSWSIFSETGQQVLTGQIAVSQSLESILLPPSLPSGTYRISLASEGKSASRSFQVRR
ncbi:MAG: hypothetical protein RIQ34_1378, partial [Bacteroidota bacterium]